MPITSIHSTKQQNMSPTKTCNNGNSCTNKGCTFAHPSSSAGEKQNLKKEIQKLNLQIQQLNAGGKAVSEKPPVKVKAEKVNKAEKPPEKVNKAEKPPVKVKADKLPEKVKAEKPPVKEVKAEKLFGIVRPEIDHQANRPHQTLMQKAQSYVVIHPQLDELTRLEKKGHDELYRLKNLQTSQVVTQPLQPPQQPQPSAQQLENQKLFLKFQQEARRNNGRS